jgi:hypothetical protein
MTFMHVLLVELLCQATMGQIPTFEYMLSRHGWVAHSLVGPERNVA